jgi:hypothetical protein
VPLRGPSNFQLAMKAASRETDSPSGLLMKIRCAPGEREGATIFNAFMSTNVTAACGRRWERSRDSGSRCAWIVSVAPPQEQNTHGLFSPCEAFAAALRVRREQVISVQGGPKNHQPAKCLGRTGVH